MVTARIAGLSPGTSPPPVKIPMVPFFFFTWVMTHLLYIFPMGPKSCYD
jgi:hypothetical protein